MNAIEEPSTVKMRMDRRSRLAHEDFNPSDASTTMQGRRIGDLGAIDFIESPSLNRQDVEQSLSAMMLLQA
jgi:hypothetical protein